MLDAVIAGETDEKKLADLAQRKMSGKIAELQQALRGRLTEHHRFLLRLLRKELEQQEGLIAELSQRIEELTRPFRGGTETADPDSGDRTAGRGRAAG